VSGAQLNPAVTVALWTVGRIRTDDLAGYIIAQLVGGIAGGRRVAGWSGRARPTSDRHRDVL
jgi:glycerol uptake facilitator-like aquaporin